MAQENSVQVLLYVNLSPFYYNFMADDLKKKVLQQKNIEFSHYICGKLHLFGA
jgi:hypothetical protein